MTKKALSIHIGLALLLLLATLLIFDLTDLDVRFQDMLFDQNSHTWIIDRHDHLLKLIFYNGIKSVLILFVVAVFLFRMLASNSTFVELYKKPIAIFLLSAMLIPGTVGLLKSATNVPCPKNINSFDGDTTYYKLFDISKRSAHHFECFPAGHASGGFMLLSLMFFFKQKKHQYLSLVSALTVGWSMGFYKMAIGHHFLSHTIVSMLIAWLIVLLVSRLILYGFPFLDASKKELLLTVESHRS